MLVRSFMRKFERKEGTPCWIVLVSGGCPWMTGVSPEGVGHGDPVHGWLWWRAFQAGQCSAGARLLYAT